MQNNNDSRDSKDSLIQNIDIDSLIDPDKTMILKKSVLKSGEEKNGIGHKGETFIFISGFGTLNVYDIVTTVRPGFKLVIPNNNTVYKIYNDSNEDLYFLRIDTLDTSN